MSRKLVFWDYVILFAVALAMLSYFGFLSTDDCIDTSQAGERDCTAHGIAYRTFFKLRYADVDWPLIITTLSTAAVAVFTLTLWLSTRKLSELAEEQGIATERAIGIATASSAESKRAADIAETTLEATHRPWLMITDIQPSVVAEILPGTCHIVTDVLVKNVGNSPALGINVTAIPIFESSDDAIEADVSSWLQAMVNPISRHGRGQTLFHRDSDKYYSNIQSGIPKGCDISKGSIRVAVCVLYGFPFSDKDDLYTVNVYSLARVYRGETSEKPQWKIEKTHTYTN